MSEYDVVVVGGGAAGLSAALVLTRARRAVAVVDSGAPRNAPAARMHGFLSRDGFPPRDLLMAGQEEVKRYGGEIISGVVTEAACVESGLRLVLADGLVVTAQHVVIASGLRDLLPEIPGVRERWGIDLLHCPYCHGFEVRDQPLGVIGGSAEAVQHAQLVRQWSSDVVFFPHAQDLTGDQRSALEARRIDVVDGRVTRVVVAQDRLHGLEVDDRQIVRRSAVFVRPRFVPNNHVPLSLGCHVDEDGWPTADSDGRTSVPGVWVAGNVANPRAQVITAAGEGSAVAIALNAELVDQDVQQAVHRLRSIRSA